MTLDITSRRASQRAFQRAQPVPQQDVSAQPDQGWGKRESLVLSPQNFEQCLAILQDPAPSTPALVRAMREYEALREAYPDRGL